MFTAHVTSSNSLIRAIDGALNRNSAEWKAAKKMRKRDKMAMLSNIGDSFWKTVKELKTNISDSIEKSIRNSTVILLRHLKMLNLKPESKEAIDRIESNVPVVTKMADTKVRESSYAALRLNCLKYKLTPPIILYGRLFEEERFQYVSFIFGKQSFIIELMTDNIDVQERACETMNALIRKSGGVPKLSCFIKVSRNVAHSVAQIDLQNTILTSCESVPDDLEILNLNEIMDLIVASHYLSNQPRAVIEEICAQTLFYKQPFLEGLHVNRKNVFGYVEPPEKQLGPTSEYPIILVFCDTVTQSNFLWNNKPLTVNVKQLAPNADRVTSKVPHQQLQLLPVNVVSDSDECGGIRYGDQILYDGPLVLVFD